MEFRLKPFDVRRGYGRPLAYCVVKDGKTTTHRLYWKRFKWSVRWDLFGWLDWAGC